MKTINYAEYCRVCGFWGFASPPLTEAQFNAVQAAGLEKRTYEIGCDIAGAAFKSVYEAIEYYKAS